MANTCCTDFRVICNKDFVDKIEALFNNADGKFYKSVSVSEVLTYLGVEPEEGYSLRGSWDLIDIDPDLNDDTKFVISILEESAWSATQTMAWIAEKYDIKYFFFEEECGCDIFVTNDEEGLFFPFRWRVYTDNDGEEYFATLNKAISYINNTLHTDYKTKEDTEDDERVCLNQIEVSNDL